MWVNWSAERLSDGGPVHVLEIAPDRNTARESCDPRSQRPDLVVQVHRSRLSFDRRIGCDDDLLDLPVGLANPL